MHSLDGILEPDRQLREHRRDLVVVAPALIVGADRHGHERTHDAPVDGLAATEHEVPEATRDHGEHDIVDGATVNRADLLDVHQPGPRPVPPPMWADRAVERARRAPSEKRSHVHETSRGLAGLPSDATGTPRGRHHGPQPTSPTTASRDPAAVTSPARPEFAARRRHQAPEVPCAARGTRG